VNLIFSEIEPGQIDGLWHVLSPAVDEFRQRFGEHMEWTGKDLKSALKSDAGRTIFVYDGKDRIGFIVVRRFTEEFTKAKYLHLWVGHLFRKYRGRIREFLPEVFVYLKKMAHNDGAKYIEMDSPRMGWERIMQRYGMVPKRMVYRQEV
jgi:hypothetical protein